MPTMTGTQVNLAANSVSANLLAGLQYEFTEEDSKVRVYAVRDAAATLVNLTFIASPDVIMNDQVIPFIGTSINRKDHKVLEVDVAAGTRMIMTLREASNVATSDVVWLVDVIPLSDIAE